MTGPDELRVGDAERTKVTEALHDHFVQGRLTRDELDERLEATLSAKTYGDLRQITRDLPGTGPLVDPEPPARAPAPHPFAGRRPRGLPFLPFVVGVFLVTALLSGGTMWAMVGVLKLIFLVWLVMALLGFMHARRRRRRAGRFGPPPGRWQGPYGPSGPYGGRSRGGRRQRRGPWDW